MKIAQVKIEKTQNKEIIFNESIEYSDLTPLDIQNIDDISDLGGNLPKKNDFFPACVDVCNGDDIKVDVTDIIKKQYNGNADYTIKVTLEVITED